MKQLALYIALITAVIIGYVAPPATAFELKLPGAAAGDPISGAAARAEKTGTNHKYVQVTFAEGADQCTVWETELPLSYVGPTALNFSMRLVNSHTSSVSSGNIVVRVDVACGSGLAPNFNWKTIAFDSGANATISLPSSTDEGELLGTANGFGYTGIDETDCEPGEPIAIRACRLGTNGSDSYLQSVGLIHARLTD